MSSPAASPTPTFAASALSVNALAQAPLERLLRDADALRIAVGRNARGVRVVDAGIAVPGSVDAGLCIAEVCMGGLGRVALHAAPPAGAEAGWPTWLQVTSAQPVLACLASQYAGWSLSASAQDAGGKRFFSLGSGPARALAAKEPLYAELGYRDPSGGDAVLVLEVDRVPPDVVVDKVLNDCGLEPAQLTLVLTPTRSAAGTTQVVARVLEVALHKAHELGFALADIVDGSATAPLPAPCPDGVQAMGRTNDAILYGGRVHLSVRGDDAAARRLAERLPSGHSPDYGTSFAELFKRAGYDFYKIDPALFAPAEVWVSNRDSGNTWHAGRLNLALLAGLWLQQA